MLPTPQRRRPRCTLPDQVFVARERELDRLNRFLDRALAGHGQVCFVTGEAGAGKTALVGEFARRAQAQHADLLVASGECNAQTGIGDPYLPFREVLGLLTGGVEAKVAQGAVTPENAGRLQAFLRVSGQTLVEYGPDLIDIFVPGGALLTRVAGRLAERAGWVDGLEELLQRKAERPAAEKTGLDQAHIFEQYTNVLKALAAQQPLLLVVDDLQWADAASISLLFHLARRIAGSRILIVGAYRADEVALGRADEGPARHPLEKVLAECKRNFGDVWVDLDQTEAAEGRRLIDALLDARPNCLGEAFRQALFWHTRGHPLFTIELLRDMQERGDLLPNAEGRLVEGRPLDWTTLPARVEGVIEERIGRLEEELREILSVASVEGEDFTAQVIAGVQAIQERQLLHKLSRELAKRHGLVQERGETQVGRQLLSRYRFAHILFQQYLYDELGAGERRLLHGEIAALLEKLYAGRTDEIAVQLVRHFDLAADVEKVLKYAVQAGDRAHRLGASLEAIDFYQLALKKALELETHDHRLELQQIHERLGDVYLVNLSRHDEALEHYGSFLALATSEEDLARGARNLGWVHLLRGDLTAAQEHYETALARLNSLPPLAEASRVHYGLAVLFMTKNRWDKAAEHTNASFEISRQVDDARGLADATKMMGIIAARQGKLEEACAQFERSLALYRELDDLARAANTYNNLGNSYRELGQMGQALGYLNQGLELARRIGDTRDEANLLVTTAELLLDQGQWATAVAHLEQAMPLAEESGVAARIVEVHSILGVAYEGMGQWAEAQRHLDIAAVLARDTQSLQFAPRIYLDLARLKAARGEFDAAWRDIQAAREAAGPEPSDAFLGFTQRCYGQVHSQRGDWDDAVACLEESLRLLERANLPAEVGKTHLSLGTAYARRGQEGDTGRAREQLRAALSIFQQIEARGYLAQVETRLQELRYSL
jgi:adenylate cyclase